MRCETPAQVRYELLWERVWEWCPCVECRLKRATKVVRALLGTLP